MSVYKTTATTTTTTTTTRKQKKKEKTEEKEEEEKRRRILLPHKPDAQINILMRHSKRVFVSFFNVLSDVF